LKLPEILRYKNYRKLYFAGTISELGSFTTETALMLFVFALSGNDKAYLGYTRAAFLIFLTIGSLTGGSIGERFNRRSILIFCNLCRLPLVFMLFFASTPLHVIFSISGIAFFTGIFNPSRQAMINDIVPRKDIKKANALFGSTIAVLHLVCPFLGATIYTYYKGVTPVVILDLLAFFVGLFLLRQISYRPPKKSVSDDGKRSSFIKDIQLGFSYLRNRKDLRAMYVNCMVGGLCIGILMPLLLPYALEVLGQDEKAYGYYMSCFGLGGIVGGIISNKLSKIFSPGKIISYAYLLEPFVMIFWLLNSVFYFSLFSFFIWGILVFVRIPSQLNYFSEYVETHYLTRMYSLLDLCFVVPNISGGLIIAFFSNQFSTSQMLWATAIMFFVMVVPRTLFGDVRSLINADMEPVSRDESVQDSQS
jgi:MFS family permease